MRGYVRAKVSCIKRIFSLPGSCGLTFSIQLSRIGSKTLTMSYSTMKSTCEDEQGSKIITETEKVIFISDREGCINQVSFLSL